MSVSPGQPRLGRLNGPLAGLVGHRRRGEEARNGWLDDQLRKHFGFRLNRSATLMKFCAIRSARTNSALSQGPNCAYGRASLT